MQLQLRPADASLHFALVNRIYSLLLVSFQPCLAREQETQESGHCYYKWDTDSDTYCGR